MAAMESFPYAGDNTSFTAPFGAFSQHPTLLKGANEDSLNAVSQASNQNRSVFFTGLQEEPPYSCDIGNADLSSELTCLFSESQNLNVRITESPTTQTDTGLFLYKLNALFDESDEYQHSDCDSYTTTTHSKQDRIENSADFLFQIDVDALQECDAVESKNLNTPTCACEDITKPLEKRDLLGYRGLLSDLSSSDDSDDDLGFDLFGDDDDPSVSVHNKPGSIGETFSTLNLKQGSVKKDSQTEPTASNRTNVKATNDSNRKSKPENYNTLCADDSEKCVKSNLTTEIIESWFDTNMTTKQFVKRSNSDIDWCVICMDNFNNPKTLQKCSHQFCADCITAYFKIRPQCPVCFVVYGIIEGNQPKDGTMTHTVNSRMKLPGYEKHSTIVLYYEFPDGVQTAEHPNPGTRYWGTSRTAYLPDNDEGRKVLRLLKEAFKRRLVFTVGRSRTTGADNQVTWNDIHHKTCTHGGQQGFGYPDPTYLSRVQEELAAFGVTEENMKENK